MANSPALSAMLARLSSTVTDVGCSIDQFWTSNRFCVTLEEFADLASAVEAAPMAEQIAEAKAAGLMVISVEQVMGGVQPWQSESVCEFTQRRLAHQLPLQSPPESPVQPPNSRVRPKTASSVASHTLRSVVTQSGASRLKSSSFYLTEHRRRETERARVLSHTLLRAEQEQNYQLAIQVAELNDLCARLQQPRRYQLDTREHTRIQQINTTNNISTDMDHKQFSQIFKNTKLAARKLRNKPEGTLQDDLRKVYVEVICACSEIEQQIKVLVSKGVTY